MLRTEVRDRELPPKRPIAKAVGLGQCRGGGYVIRLDPLSLRELSSQPREVGHYRQSFSRSIRAQFKVSPQSQHCLLAFV